MGLPVCVCSVGLFVCTLFLTRTVNQRYKQVIPITVCRVLNGDCGDCNSLLASSSSVNLIALSSCLHSVKFLAFHLLPYEESVSGRHNFLGGGSHVEPRGAARTEVVFFFFFQESLFGETRGRPEVNHPVEKEREKKPNTIRGNLTVCLSRRYQSSLLELPPPHLWQLTFLFHRSTFFFFFYLLRLLRLLLLLTEHCTDTLLEEKRTPSDTFQTTYLSTTLHSLCTTTGLQRRRTEQLHQFVFFPGKPRKKTTTKRKQKKRKKLN